MIHGEKSVSKKTDVTEGRIRTISGSERKEMQVLSGVYWDCGQRLHNEDSVALQQVLTCRGRALLAVVCDGIGGLAQGETASGYVVERLVECFYRQLVVLIGKGKSRRIISNRLSTCFYEIGHELNVYGRTKEVQLGSTVSVLLLWRNQYVIAHIGDSRIYWCKKNGMQQLTNDHSDGRHGLSKCIGSFPFQKMQMLGGRIFKSRGVLLCTDGFYRRMTQNTLWNPSDIYEEHQIEKRLQANADYVKAKGEKDNLTAIYLKLSRR